MSLLIWIVCAPVAGGCLLSLLCVWTTWRFVSRPAAAPGEACQPPVSVLKPIYGLDRDLESNLRSFCDQDYPELQVVFSLQRADDPALPVVRRLEADYPARVTVVIGQSEPRVNGKVQNLLIALEGARHEVLVVSDSDVHAPPGYVRAMVSPLGDASIGYVCSLYRIARPRTLADVLEVLTINVEFMPRVIFAYVTRASGFCLGASIAFRRTDLNAVGGMAEFADYLVEDYEFGRRLMARGFDMRLVPICVDMIPEYRDLTAWWSHHVYWDQNTKAAHFWGFALGVFTITLPFAIVFAALKSFSAVGLAVLGGAFAVRVGCAAAVARMLDDTEAMRALWLLPLRDVLGLASWARALPKRTFVWRGHTFGLTPEGRIVSRDAAR